MKKWKDDKLIELLPEVQILEPEDWCELIAHYEGFTTLIENERKSPLFSRQTNIHECFTEPVVALLCKDTVRKTKNKYGIKPNNVTVSYDLCTLPNIISDVKGSASETAQVPSFTSDKGLADFYIHIIFFRVNNLWSGDFNIFIEGKSDLMYSNVNKLENLLDQQAQGRRPRQNKTEHFASHEPFFIGNIYDRPIDVIDLNNLPLEYQEKIEINNDQTTIFPLTR
jgi:hypothetical protein